MYNIDFYVRDGEYTKFHIGVTYSFKLYMLKQFLFRMFIPLCLEDDS